MTPETHDGELIPLKIETAEFNKTTIDKEKSRFKSLY